MSFTRLLPAWASTIPTAASRKSQTLKPGARTARSPAIAAEVSVIGWTHARVRTSQRLTRSEEHTSELQSHSDLVCRLLLEKKKKHNNTRHPQANTEYGRMKCS